MFPHGLVLRTYTWYVKNRYTDKVLREHKRKFCGSTNTLPGAHGKPQRSGTLAGDAGEGPSRQADGQPVKCRHGVWNLGYKARAQGKGVGISKFWNLVCITKLSSEELSKKVNEKSLEKY